MTITATEVKLYPCTHCKKWLPAEKFSRDVRRVNRDFLASWCKVCAGEASRRSRAEKIEEEQKLKAKREKQLAKELALSQHPISKPFVYENFTAIDLGDIGVMVRLNNPNLPDEMLAERFPPSEVNALIEWLGKSNEGKKKGR